MLRQTPGSKTRLKNLEKQEIRNSSPERFKNRDIQKTYLKLLFALVAPEVSAYAQCWVLIRDIIHAA
jgi:hypothetical protein